MPTQAGIQRSRWVRPKGGNGRADTEAARTKTAQGPDLSVAAAGFLVIASLATRKVPVAIIIGVLGVTLIAVAFGLEPWHGLAARRPRSRRPSLR
jgi:xanthine/uracil/vitamin C permease (AzgA family)